MNETTFPVLEQVKPSSNQVNLASCCVMPPDLTAFAKEFDIQLLTHNDPKGETWFSCGAFLIRIKILFFQLPQHLVLFCLSYQIGKPFELPSVASIKFSIL